MDKPQVQKCRSPSGTADDAHSHPSPSLQGQTLPSLKTWNEATAIEIQKAKHRVRGLARSPIAFWEKVFCLESSVDSPTTKLEKNLDCRGRIIRRRQK